ncbi:MAG: MBL fold metallo-hydrolase [Holdemanella sp.]|mgnify:CR=1 FL=1|nr:MBL fold metallo-hydrolase [Holdemanella sp.]
MRIDLLTSGSKGNSCLVRDGKTTILIDCGSTKKYLMDEFRNVDVKVNDIQGVLITHAHTDHVSQLKHFAHLPVYSFCSLDAFKLADYRRITPGTIFTIGTFTIRVIRLSHDSPNTIGFVIYNDLHKLVYITDTGYIPNNEHAYLKDANYYILESNHDIGMLMASSRPMYLKQRILGDSGHLCNELASKYLLSFIGERTKYVILAHISDECNTIDRALDVFNDELSRNKHPFNGIVKAMPQRTRYSIVD